MGAINISLFVKDKFVCASHPQYGQTPGKAGDEQGYVVAMSPCVDKSTTGSLQIAKGDKVRLDSWYWVGRDDPRIYPLPGGTHLNVMGYMYVCIFCAVRAVFAAACGAVSACSMPCVPTQAEPACAHANAPSHRTSRSVAVSLRAVPVCCGLLFAYFCARCR